MLNNNTLIIFKKNGVGTTPGADSIRALRPDFQVPFLATTFLFKVWHSFRGLFAQNRTCFAYKELAMPFIEFARICRRIHRALTYFPDAYYFLLWMTRLCRCNSDYKMYWNEVFVRLFAYIVLYRNLCANELSNFLSKLLLGSPKKKIDKLSPHFPDNLYLCLK